MTQTIEQLTARVHELEEKNAELHEQVDMQIPKLAFAQLQEKLAAAQAYAEQLREALENHSGNYKLSKAECKIINDLLDKPHDTSALDAYVAERVQESIEMYRQANLAKTAHMLELTRQRDLAVGALGKLRGMAPADDALQAIKESEEN